MRNLTLLNVNGTTSEFQADIPNNFSVGKNCKIALEQLNLTFEGNEVVIDNTNNTLQFNVGSRAGLQADEVGPNAITATLPHKSHSSMDTLLKDVDVALNSSVKMWGVGDLIDGNGNVTDRLDNYQGLQFQVTQDTDKKVNLRYSHKENDKSTPLSISNCVDNANPGGGAAGNWIQKTAGDNTKFDGFVQSRLSLSKSNGLIRVPVKMTDVNTDFIIGVSKYQYNPAEEFTLNKFICAIYSDSSANMWKIKYGNTIANFTKLSNGTTITKTMNQAVVGMTWGTVNGVPKIKFYLREGNSSIFAGPDYSTNFINFDLADYADSQNYLTISMKQTNVAYFGYSGLSQANGATMISTMNAFEQVEDNTLHILPLLRDVVRVNADLEDPSLGTYSDKYRYLFFNSNLGKLLGFVMNGLAIECLPGNSVKIADDETNIIKMSGFAPKNLVLTVPSLDLESYQNYGYKTNILAVVPNSDRSNYELSYKVNEKVFIHLRNRDVQDIPFIVIRLTDDSGMVFNVGKNTFILTLIIDDEI